VIQMKKTFLAFALLCLVGCSGVQMNAKYSELLDKTAAQADEIAVRASDGRLNSDEKTTALVEQAKLWNRFREARDGKKSE